MAESYPTWDPTAEDARFIQAVRRKHQNLQLASPSCPPTEAWTDCNCNGCPIVTAAPPGDCDNQEVFPDPAELHVLLGDPEAALLRYFPDEAADLRPPSLADCPSMAWTNHCFGARVMVMELHAIATGKTLLPMVLGGIRSWGKEHRVGISDL